MECSIALCKVQFIYKMANKQALNALVILELLDSEGEEGDNNNGQGKTREWLKRRRELGYYTKIVQELQLEDTNGFKEMMRMDYKYFKEILNLVEPDITPQEIIGGNKVISAAERLTLTLRFLATGETFQSMSFQFRISDRTISYIVKDVCDAIVKYLVPLVPSSEEEWVTIADKFESRWQYPNAIGAIDGKHVVIRKPSHVGSHYYNYKHSHSIILMAIAGPSYECLYADVGANGRVNDGGVWNKCGFSNAIENNQLSLPTLRCLPGGVQNIPFVLIGDDAFALKKHMMKSYPQQNLTTERRVYNYRHSRGRRISENLFGIIANR